MTDFEQSTEKYRSKMTTFAWGWALILYIMLGGILLVLIQMHNHNKKVSFEACMMASGANLKACRESWRYYL